MLEYNQVYNMDCLEGMKEIPQGTVNLVIADPPYFLGMTSNGQKGAFSDLNICKPFYIELAKEIERVLRYDGEFYIFMDWRSLAFYFPIFDDFLPVKNLIVWDKIAGPGNFYSYNHEFILYGTKNGTLKKGGSNVWHYKGFSSGAKATDGEKIHPAQKPTELIARIIAESCPRGGVVLDPFMGSYTTAVCAHRAGVKFLGFEIDAARCEIGQKRLEEEKNQLTLFGGDTDGV